MEDDVPAPPAPEGLDEDELGLPGFEPRELVQNLPRSLVRVLIRLQVTSAANRVRSI
jgi:hypothetical protein